MHVFMCLYVCLYESACVVPCVCVSVYVVVCGVYVCVTVSENAFECLHVSMYSSGSITWADPQRERLTCPCVQSSHPLGSMVPSWALPHSSSGLPHQTSPHCLSPCMCIEKRGVDPWRIVTTALSESCDGPPIKALIRSPCTDAEIQSRSIWDPDWGLLLASEWHRGG